MLLWPARDVIYCGALEPVLYNSIEPGHDKLTPAIPSRILNFIARGHHGSRRCGSRHNPTAGAPPAFNTSLAVGPEVSGATFAEAEKLVQVTLSEPQRAIAGE